jgi:hypothetical protein
LAAFVRDTSVFFFSLSQALGDHMGCDEEAKKQEQRRRDEQLRRDSRAVVVDLGARRTAHRAAAFDHRAGTVSADQVLAAHL